MEWRRSPGSWKERRTSPRTVTPHPADHNSWVCANAQRRPRATIRSRLLPGGVARLRLLVHGIEAGQFGSTLDLADDEALHALVLGALLGDKSEEILWDYHRPVVVADDDVTRKDCAAAAADRLLPSDESQTVDGSRRSGTCGPNRELGGKHARLVAHDPIGHQRRDIALHHAHGEDVAENAGRGDAHRIGHRDTTFRHFFDGAAGGHRLRPAFRSREVLTHRHETQGEGRAYDAPGTGKERLRPVHPAAADPFFQEHRGDSRGGDRPQSLVKGGAHEHTSREYLCNAASNRGHTEAGIAPAQPGHARDGDQHHPSLADDLTEQEFERAESEPQKDDRVDDEANDTRRDDGNDQSAARE